MPHVPIRQTHHYRFADFEFCERSGELLRNGEAVPLPHQAAKVLLALLRSQGQVVTREDLRMELWPDKVSGEFESGINVAIAKLRKALEDDGASPTRIGTLPMHGYRMLVPVEVLEDGPEVPAAAVEPAGVPPETQPSPPGVLHRLRSGLQRLGPIRLAILGGVLVAAGLLYGLFSTPGIRSGSGAGERVRDRVSGMEFVWIPPGTFTMGSPASEEGRESDEGPQHEVEISQGFWMGKSEVTQGQYEAVMGTNPSCFKEVGPQAPVENVSWNDAQAFLQKLTQRGNGQVYRLPTEAEWEYACRAGSVGRTYGPLDIVSWNPLNSFITPQPVGQRAAKITRPVGQKQPNAWGLYDTLGNVYEWCQDWYSGNPYPALKVTDPKGLYFGSDRVYRGGAFATGTPLRVRAAYRGKAPPRRPLRHHRLPCGMHSPLMMAGGRDPTDFRSPLAGL